MATIGYAHLIERFSLKVCPLAKPAALSSSVNRRVNAHDHILFPLGVAIEDTPIGHLEFALRHEGVNLELIDALFDHLLPEDLLSRFEQTPNGAHIRRACFLWEWLTGQELPTKTLPGGGYVDLFPQGDYVTADQPENNRKFRVRNNALGTSDFCPVVSRSALSQTPTLVELMQQAQKTLASVIDPALYERALCTVTKACR